MQYRRRLGIYPLCCFLTVVVDLVVMIDFVVMMVDYVMVVDPVNHF